MSDAREEIPDREELKRRLSPLEWHVTQEGGTEPAFTGRWVDHHADGVYVCVCCGAPLFDARDKFDSGSGWPSFTRPVDERALERRLDLSHGMRRVEVRCARCDAHLGHVFEDGPPPTGLRHCINSAALDHRPRDPEE